jgi:polyisoprenoid-binding protein YceI
MSITEKKIKGTISYDPKNPDTSKSEITITTVDGASMMLSLDEGSE